MQWKFQHQHANTGLHPSLTHSSGIREFSRTHAADQGATRADEFNVMWRGRQAIAEEMETIYGRILAHPGTEHAAPAAKSLINKNIYIMNLKNMIKWVKCKFNKSRIKPSEFSYIKFHIMPLNPVSLKQLKLNIWMILHQ